MLPYDYAWAALKSHTMILDNQDMWDRINCLIDFAADDQIDELDVVHGRVYI